MAAEWSGVQGDGVWWLQRLGGGTPGDRLLLRHGAEVTLGRGLGVTYQLLAKSCPLMISRNHCSFLLTSEGVCTVTDNQSLNGVWVNGERVTAHQPRVLSEGDVVQLGVPVEPQTQAEFEYRLVRRRLETRAGTAEGSGTKRKQAAEGDEPGGMQGQAGSGKLRRVGEYRHQSRSAGSADTVQHQQPGTRQLPRDSSGGQNAGIEAQEQQHRAWDQGHGLPTDQERPHGDRDQGPRLPTDRERPHGDRDPGHGDRGQGPRLPTDQERPHGDRDQGPRLPTDQERPHGDQDQGHGDRDQGPRLPTDQAGTDSVETQISEVLENELQCIICSEHFVQAVTLGCSHTFCGQCIDEWRRRSAHCPMCWRPILWQTRSVVLDGCIERLVSGLGTTARRHRQRLLRARQELTWDEVSGPAGGDDPEGGHSQLSEAGPSRFTEAGPSVNGSRPFQVLEPEAAANLYHPPRR